MGNRPTREEQKNVRSRLDDRIALSINATNRDDIASATISTFSFKWGRTEDWRPYWEACKSCVDSKQYPVVDLDANP